MSSSAHDSDLHNLDAMTLIDDPTPKQSQVARPKTTRGDIPAFVSEIGHGAIPGEEEGRNRGQEDERLSKSYASAHGSFDEEKRRRRSEKERAQRHQRSKDVTILPPLLGVSRTSSGVNLQAHNKPNRPHHHSHHSSTASLTGINNRNRSGSYGQQNMYSGSFSQLNGLVQPSTTPLLRPGQGLNGRLTPSIELGSSPSRMMSVGSLGTSPRRGGLGWGAMTPIASPGATETTFAPARPSSHASHRHRHHQSSGSSSRHRSSGSSNGSNNNLVVLGHVGQLGFHPQGHGPVYGRHATTPVRSSTPRVPEDGGEMSGAALKGEDDIERIYGHSQRRSSMAPPMRPGSGMNTRRQSDLAPPPPPMMKRNSAGLSPLMQQRNISSDELAPVKMYPVLDIPNRQPTHDRYDANWLGTEADPQKETSQTPPVATRLQPPDNQTSTHRKRLFYFDTT
jgi:hypothetical protein